MWNYQEQYEKLLAVLKDNQTPWILVSDQEPPQNGQKIFFMCGENYKHEVQYDIGEWADYTEAFVYKVYKEAGDDYLEGEWNTEFGNCAEIVAWKLVGTTDV